MDDEIKEILDEMKFMQEKKVKFYSLDICQSKLLLNYITNLQQENEELKKNQRYYKNGVFSLEYDKETMSDMIDDYKSRVEKAVEYIREEIKDMPENGCRIRLNEVLNILNGRSDE